MLRGDELSKEKWALLKVDYTTMAEEALMYLPYTGLEELADKRNKIKTFDIGWAEQEIAFARQHGNGDPTRLTKATAKIAAAHAALRKIDEFEADIRRRATEAPRPPVGARVRVCADIMDMVGSPCSAYPEIGIIGIVEDMSHYEGKAYESRALRIKVRFRQDLLGYEIDEDYDLDSDDNTVAYYLYPFEIEQVGDDVETRRPHDEPKEPVVLVPAPEGMRYAVFTGEREVGGTGCYTHAEMTEYAKGLGMEVRTVPISDLDRQLGHMVVA